MQIITDENIAYAGEAFSTLGTVHQLPGRGITRESLANADALIIRSVTKVDAALLEGTSVRFVGTATIGTDHIDLPYLRSKGITFTDAKGCNADAVAEYVWTAIFHPALRTGKRLQDLTIGICGVGNIGSRIRNTATALGMGVVLCDPPLKDETGSDDYRPLHELRDADIVTFHTPYTIGGKYPTHHLADEAFFRSLKDGSIVINASRGEVADNAALARVAADKGLKLVLDVWEGEPSVHHPLLEQSLIASPHIAGYTLEGKINGTSMVYKALSKFAGMNGSWTAPHPPVEHSERVLQPGKDAWGAVGDLLCSIYEPLRDTEAMKQMMKMSDSEGRAHFDQLRKHYPLRREFFNYRVDAQGYGDDVGAIVKALRFH